jgi:predicted AlkP superfamily phosphohydrolase/phosphomutase
MASLLVLGHPGTALAQDEPVRNVIVMGFDGMDYELTQRLMNEGRLPNFSRLAEQGSFTALGTSIPPQSPVAWSNFITGMDAGGHGIFDFIHREPTTLIPYLSTSRTESSGRSLKLGKWQIPLSGGTVELLRRGEAFWDELHGHGTESWIIRIPANFPPSGTATVELSGMGTPDLQGTYGTFSYFTTDPSPWDDDPVTGGEIFPVRAVDHVVQGQLHGPDNPFLSKPTELQRPFTVYVDPEDPVAKIVVGDTELVVGVGEWTEWVPIEFDLIPTQKLRGIVRFYLKSLRPEFQLYATPINIDPLHPAMPISTPPSFAAELANETGYYYTQGMPEDTKSYSEGVFDAAEFLSQARIAGDELIEQYKYLLDRFENGLFFYYFGNGDQISHMVWRSMDPEHPAYDPEIDAQFADVVPQIYEQFDALVGYTLERVDSQTTVIAMSDHGFTSWRRSFHLNSWLRDNGYLAVKNPNLKKDPGFLMNVDWGRTTAYGLGLNGLYLNLRGREKFGTVRAEDRDVILSELEEKLLAVVDPETGKPAITKAYSREEAYQDRGVLELGPDMLIGYAKMMRGSNESALGEIPAELFEDNTSEWSGDHCMDHETVPGILLSSRKLKQTPPDLKHLGGAILIEMGLAPGTPEVAAGK